MAERSSKAGGPDRKHVEGREGYEVDDLVKRFGISNDQASRLIRQNGADRDKIEAAAAKLTKR